MTQKRCLTLADIERVMQLMKTHDVSTISVGDVSITRQPPQVDPNALAALAKAAVEEELTEEELLMNPTKGIPGASIPRRVGAQ